MKRLDLHGLRHEEAKRATIRFIEDHWNSDLDAEIITGNSKKMREIVTEILDEYMLPYDKTRLGYIKTLFE